MFILIVNQFHFYDELVLRNLEISVWSSCRLN